MRRGTSWPKYHGARPLAHAQPQRLRRRRRRRRAAGLRYTTGGWTDWQGNATGERAYTQTGGRWQYGSLWQSFVMSGVEVILLDTVTLTGEMFDNPASVPANWSYSDDATNWNGPLMLLEV